MAVTFHFSKRCLWVLSTEKFRIDNIFAIFIQIKVLLCIIYDVIIKNITLKIDIQEEKLIVKILWIVNA